MDESSKTTGSQGSKKPREIISGFLNQVICLAIPIEDIYMAQKMIAKVIDETPLTHSHTLSRLTSYDVYLKLENLQRTGSFKLRGAYNKIANLPEAKRRVGVMAASAGNHAQGVAFAAKHLGIPCLIVMPEGASLSKIEATRGYGAQVVLTGETFDKAFQDAIELQKQNGMTFIHAFDDADVIAGQGTIGIELLEQLPDLDAVVLPVGGGGLIAGIASAIKALKPGIKVYGVEAAGAACFRRSFDEGQRTAVSTVATIADGIAVGSPGRLTWEIAASLVDDIFVVDDEDIARAMVILLERSKVVSEGAGAAAVASLLTHQLPTHTGKTAVVISGGNVDVSLVSRTIEHGLVAAGRRVRFITTLPDRPGVLAKLLQTVANARANVISIEHHRLAQSLVLGYVEVQLEVETRDHAHIELLCEHFRALGYEYAIH